MAKLLAQFFAHAIEADKKVDTRREVLAEIMDFEPFSAYQTIIQYDRTAFNEQAINIQALKKFLEVNNTK